MSIELTVGVATYGDSCRILKDMINSLYHYTKVDFKLIVVNNASLDSTVHELKILSSKKDIVVINNSINYDVTVAMNQILEIVNTPLFLMVDNDTLFIGDGPIEYAISYLKTTCYSLIAPYWDLSLRRRKEISKWDSCHTMKLLFNKADNLVKKINHHFEVSLRLPRGHFMMMKTEDIANIGGFDENYPHNAMEYPLAMRLLENGYDFAEYINPNVVHNPPENIRTKVRKKIRDQFKLNEG